MKSFLTLLLDDKRSLLSVHMSGIFLLLTFVTSQDSSVLLLRYYHDFKTLLIRLSFFPRGVCSIVQVCHPSALVFDLLVHSVLSSTVSGSGTAG